MFVRTGYLSQINKDSDSLSIVTKRDKGIPCLVSLRWRENRTGKGRSPNERRPLRKAADEILRDKAGGIDNF